MISVSSADIKNGDMWILEESLTLIKRKGTNIHPCISDIISDLCNLCHAHVKVTSTRRLSIPQQDCNRTALPEGGVIDSASNTLKPLAFTDTNTGTRIHRLHPVDKADPTHT